MAVNSYSVTKDKVKRIAAVKRYCDKRRLNLSRIIVDLLDNWLAEQEDKDGRQSKVSNPE